MVKCPVSEPAICTDVELSVRSIHNNLGLIKVQHCNGEKSAATSISGRQNWCHFCDGNDAVDENGSGQSIAGRPRLHGEPLKSWLATRKTGSNLLAAMGLWFVTRREEILVKQCKFSILHLGGHFLVFRETSRTAKAINFVALYPPDWLLPTRNEAWSLSYEITEPCDLNTIVSPGFGWWVRLFAHATISNIWHSSVSRNVVAYLHCTLKNNLNDWLF